MQLDVALPILPARHFQVTLAFDTGSIGWSTIMASDSHKTSTYDCSDGPGTSSRCPGGVLVVTLSFLGSGLANKTEHTNVIKNLSLSFPPILILIAAIM